MRWIYLHGFASGPASKKAQFFREKFERAGIALEIPDLAAGDFEHLTITGQLRVIEQAAKGEPASLIGSSMGGYLAALYAARHAEVGRVALMAPAFCFARRFSAMIPAAELGEWKRTGYRAVYHYGDDRERRLHYGLIEDGLKYEDYPEVTQPVLIFHGVRDAHVPHAASEEFAALRPNSRLVLLDSDHELLSALEAMWRETERFVFGEAGR